MATDDRVEVIPHMQARDARTVVRGDINSGVGNMRMLVGIDTPQFSLDLGGTELAASIAEMIAEKLRENFSQGLDAQGRSLPPIMEATRARRERRKAQREDDLNAKRDRLKVRGGKHRGKDYDVADVNTPFHESGIAAENVQVQFKGTESGNPVFLIALPSGGKQRGLVNDDGRGARLFAAEHYGFENLMDIPHELDASIDKALEGHWADVLAAGGSTMKMFGQFIGKVGAIIEAGASGEGADV